MNRNFELFKQAKRIVNNMEKYSLPNIESDDLKIDGKTKIYLRYINGNLRPIEIVELDTQEYTFAMCGFFALEYEPQMVIVNCDEIDCNFLDESGVIGLLFGERVSKIKNNILFNAPTRYIYVSAKNKSFHAENNVLFSKDKSRLIKYAPCRPEKEYRVPKETKILSWYSFLFTEHLEVLYLPKNIDGVENAKIGSKVKILYY